MLYLTVRRPKSIRIPQLQAMSWKDSISKVRTSTTSTSRKKTSRRWPYLFTWRDIRLFGLQVGMLVHVYRQTQKEALDFQGDVSCNTHTHIHTHTHAHTHTHTDTHTWPWWGRWHRLAPPRSWAARQGHLPRQPPLKCPHKWVTKSVILQCVRAHGLVSTVTSDTWFSSDACPSPLRRLCV
jgi:hypothetical protein